MEKIMSKTTDNTEVRELSEDKLKAVAGGWPGAWMGFHDNNYTPHGGGFQNETYDTSITFGWSHIT
jgi:hypothetical protein